MKTSLLVKHVLPFSVWYGMMVLITLALDYLLHTFHLVYIGRYLGIVGTLLICVSFVYSLRKRKIISSGSPKQVLLLHEYLAWSGSILLFVHAGIHFNALLPWLATGMLFIVVALGLVGKFILKDSVESLKIKRAELLSTGMNKEEVERKLFFDSITLDMMKQWRNIHLPVSFLFGLLSLMHIVTILVYSR